MGVPGYLSILAVPEYLYALGIPGYIVCTLGVPGYLPDNEHNSQVWYTGIAEYI